MDWGSDNGLRHALFPNDENRNFPIDIVRQVQTDIIKD